MNDPDLSRATWRKSSYSNGNGGDCVEVATVGGHAGVRDSKNPDGGTISVRHERFVAFLRVVKGGQLDS